MIFVTIGTSRPFDRLLRAVDALDLAADEELVVQCGDSDVRPAGATCLGFLPYRELADHVSRARVVIAHAGAGTVLAASALGATLVVVPRLARFGEAADDHQVDFGRHLGQAGLVTFVEDPADLATALAGVRAPGVPPTGAPAPSLTLEVRDYLRSTIHGSPAGSPPNGEGRGLTFWSGIGPLGGRGSVGVGRETKGLS